MTEHFTDGREEGTAARFEAARPMLRALAFRMLGAAGEADDVVQEAWLRLARADAAAVVNLEGWLTTVVARICLDMLRARTIRGEARLDDALDVPAGSHADAVGSTSGRVPGSDPEQEAQLADAVGLALLVVLDRLAPAERVAFVLHDAFDFPFDDIASILGRSPEAARQLASRARRRVRGTPLHEAAGLRGGDLAEQRAVVDAYLAAARAGDLDALLAVLHPDVVLRADAPAVPNGHTEAHGASAVARGALAFAERAPFSRVALVNGAVGVIVAPRGRLLAVLTPTIVARRIVAIDVVTVPARLERLDLAVLPE
jgi:RNA polymerase sigma factor (sigma-70 family)